MKKYIVLSILSLVVNSAIAQTTGDGYHFKYKKGQYFLVNAKGKKVDCEPFSFATRFSEGLAVVEKNLKFGYIDSTGQMVIDYQYYDAGPFVNGIAYAAKDGKYGYINKSGNFIIKPQFDLAYPFGNEHAIVKDMNPDTTIYGQSKMIKGLMSKEGHLIGDALYTSIWKEDNYYKAFKGDSLFHISMDGSKEYIKTDAEAFKDSVFYIVQEMPEYPGGEDELRRYVAQSIRYPVSAQEHGIHARVYLSFVVDKDGSVIDVLPVLPGPPILIQETTRFLETMSRWKAGKQDGRPVKVSYTIPLNYELK